MFWDQGRSDLEHFCRDARHPARGEASPVNHFIYPEPDQLLRVSVGPAAVTSEQYPDTSRKRFNWCWRWAVALGLVGRSPIEAKPVVFRDIVAEYGEL